MTEFETLALLTPMVWEGVPLQVGIVLENDSRSLSLRANRLALPKSIVFCFRLCPHCCDYDSVSEAVC